MEETVPWQPQAPKQKRRRWFWLLLLLVFAGGAIWTTLPTAAQPAQDAEWTPVGVCETDLECVAGEFCRLGMCAPWEPESVCSEDADCMLVNAAHRYGCCFSGECEDIDQSAESWVAVNAQWLQRGRRDFCPMKSACGSGPNCTIRSINENFAASCVERQCQKVPTPADVDE